MTERLSLSQQNETEEIWETKLGYPSDLIVVRVKAQPAFFLK